MAGEVTRKAGYPMDKLVLFEESERVCTSIGRELQRTPPHPLSIIARPCSPLRSHPAASLAACQPPLFGEDTL